MKLDQLTIGKDAPEIFNVVVEIPRGSNNKYEYDEKDHVIRLDRVVFSPFFYPADYGLIPETRSEDGDHLDALVLVTNPTFPGCVVRGRAVGLLKMIDQGELDYKILTVAVDDPRWAAVRDLTDVNEHFLKEVVHFFEEIKKLENKKVEVEGWENAAAAAAEIEKSMEQYRKET